jgi:alkaline phosphatase
MRHLSRFGLILMLGCAGTLAAAPRVVRLTPPSERFRSGATAPMVSRFLPGQRFDVQATIVPDAGMRVTSVQFQVDGAALPHGEAVLQTTGLKSKLADGQPTPEGTSVASLRAVSIDRPGRHVLRVLATQSDGQRVTAEGDFLVESLVGHGSPVRNVILLLGDGMGIAHRTAGRIVAHGYVQGQPTGLLAMDTFPDVALVRTASLNSIVTDSSPGMSNYVTGNKSANDMEGVWPDDTLDPFDNPRIEYLSEYLHRTAGTMLGLVTTADLYDATPAANAVHTGSRRAGTGIVDQYLDDRGLTGLRVLMGGGRGWFLPSGMPGSMRNAKTDYELPVDVQRAWGAAAGAVDPTRDLIHDFRAAGFQYVSNAHELAASSADAPLLGLFAYSNMNVAYDKILGRRGLGAVTEEFGLPDQPMLDEMAQKALAVLERSKHGFYLMIEGASIDKQAHAMDSDRWLDEVVEFDRAVAVAKAFAERHKDTLVLVTADHETGGSSIIGASRATTAELRQLAASGAGRHLRDGVVGTYDNAGFPVYRILADGYPETMDPDHKLLIGYGANTDRHEDWLANPRPLVDHYQPSTAPSPFPVYPEGYPANPMARDTVGDLLVTGQVGEENESAVHTGADVPLSAFGAGSQRFHGVIDNTDVFFAIGSAVRRGSEATRR